MDAKGAKGEPEARQGLLRQLYLRRGRVSDTTDKSHRRVPARTKFCDEEQRKWNQKGTVMLVKIHSFIHLKNRFLFCSIRKADFAE